MRSEHALRPQSCEGIIATIAAGVDAQNMQADIKVPRLADGAQVLQAAGILEVRRKRERIIELCDVGDLVAHLGGHSLSRVAVHLAEPVETTSDLAHDGNLL